MKETVGDPELEADTQEDPDIVCVSDTEDVGVSVVEGDEDVDRVPDALLETEMLEVSEDVDDTQAVDEWVPLREDDGEFVYELDTDDVDECVELSVGEPEAVTESDEVGEFVKLELDEDDTLGVPL